MRFLTLSVIAISLSASAAGAQSADCKSIASATDRLACYDKISPPVQQTTSPSKATSDATSKTSANRFYDPTLDDDSALRARMNNICRGC